MPVALADLTDNVIKIATAVAYRHQAEITLYHVFDNEEHSVKSSMIPRHWPNVDHVIDSYEEKLKKLAAEMEKATNAKVETRIEIGDAADSICRLAFDSDYDLIIIGTHGNSRLREFFVGSVTMKVVEKC